MTMMIARRMTMIARRMMMIARRTNVVLGHRAAPRRCCNAGGPSPPPQEPTAAVYDRSRQRHNDTAAQRFILKISNKKDTHALFESKKREVGAAFGAEAAEYVTAKPELATELLFIHRFYIQDVVEDVKDLILLRTFVRNIIHANAYLPDSLYETLMTTVRFNEDSLANR